MKNKTLNSLLVASALAIPAISNAEEKSSWNFAPSMGYQFMTFKNSAGYNHTVHQADAGFLPKNAGRTSIKSIHSGDLNLGVSHTFNNFEPYLSGGLSIRGGMDRKQNAGDIRPAANGSFVFTRVGILGGNAELGTKLYLKDSPVYLKAGVRGDLLTIESGWDRWGSKEVAHSETHTPLSALAGVGYKSSEGISGEAVFYKGISGIENWGIGIFLRADF